MKISTTQSPTITPAMIDELRFQQRHDAAIIRLEDGDYAAVSLADPSRSDWENYQVIVTAEELLSSNLAEDWQAELDETDYEDIAQWLLECERNA